MRNSKDMGLLEDLLQRVERVNDGLQGGELIRNVVVRHPDDILDLQKRQLFQGLASDGQDIRPYYSEDLKPGGWFYSVQTARNYAAWKQSLSYPYEAERNPDAPNLYIDGKFHDELGVEFRADSVEVVGTTAYAKGIVFKYGVTTFGLMPQNWNLIFEDYGGYYELMNELKTILYGKY
jgi:hypothetical protein